MSLFVSAFAGINTASVSKRQDRWQKSTLQGDVVKIATILVSTGAFVTYLKKKIKSISSISMMADIWPTTKPSKATPSPTTPPPPGLPSVDWSESFRDNWGVKYWYWNKAHRCESNIYGWDRAGNELFYWPLAQGRVFIPSIEFEEGGGEGEKTKFYTWKFRPDE